MKLLLFAGAGASVELGVPAMRQMTVQLVEYLTQQGFDENALSRLDKRLKSSGYDMESLVDELDSIVEGNRAADKWEVGDASDESLEEIETLRQETEWFIQHVCERVRLQRARYLWAPTLRELGVHDATIATTNYDRAIELASASVSKPLDDGFGRHRGLEAVPWKGFGDAGNGFSDDEIRYLKIHGSTNWYRSENGEPYKLRHPMKLFGGLKLTISQGQSKVNLNSAIVLPSREKAVREDPYDEIKYYFNKSYRNADIAIFLGSSLRDPDLKKAAEYCSQECHTYVVSPNVDKNEPNIPTKSVALNLTSSQFLCSVLPSSISSSSGVDNFADRMEKYNDRVDNPESILSQVVLSYDEEVEPEKRCNAIESLAKMRLPLCDEEIKRLLEYDDKIVSKFALGLIPESPNKDSLTEYAEKLAQSEDSVGFAEEVRLLSNEM